MSDLPAWCCASGCKKCPAWREREHRVNRTYKPRGMLYAHGTRSSYVHTGCRCEPCRAANRYYEKLRRYGVRSPEEL